MEEKYTPLKKVKIVFRSGSPALKILVILVIVFSMAALLALRWVHNGVLAETENLKDEASKIEYENEELEKKIDEVGSVQSVEDIAREELGLIDPDTQVADPYATTAATTP